MPSKSKHVVNSTYFDKIDTEEKAYFLGILFADGCNYPPHNRVVLTLTEKDIDLITKLNKIIHNKRLYYRKEYKFVNPKNGKISISKPQWKLDIIDKHISETLVKHGMVKNKSLVLQFPKNIPQNLIHHFCRGYFDGDGSIGIYSRNDAKSSRFVIVIISTKQFLTQFAKKAGISNPTILKQGKVFVLQISGRNQTEKLGRWLYNDATIYLDRKFKIYKQILSSPTKKYRLYTYKKQTKTQNKWAKILKVNPSTIAYWRNKGLQFSDIVKKCKRLTRSIK